MLDTVHEDLHMLILLTVIIRGPIIERELMVEFPRQ